jgi:hypothetical protein
MCALSECEMDGTLMAQTLNPEANKRFQWPFMTINRVTGGNVASK